MNHKHRSSVLMDFRCLLVTFSSNMLKSGLVWSWFGQISYSGLHFVLYDSGLLLNEPWIPHADFADFGGHSPLCSVAAQIWTVSKHEQDEIQVLSSSLGDTFSCGSGRGAKSSWTISPTGLLHLSYMQQMVGCKIPLSPLELQRAQNMHHWGRFSEREIIQCRVPVVNLDFININQCSERVTQVFNNFLIHPLGLHILFLVSLEEQRFYYLR